MAILVQLFRYAAALTLSSAIGALIGIPFAFAIDVVWGYSVTGGSWAFTFPNTILMAIQGAATGVVAGQIAGRRRKLIAGLAVFFPLIAFTVISLALNRDLIGAMREQLDTAPSLWMWIGLVPAVLAAHFTIKQVLTGIGAAMFGVFSYLGMPAFHFYTGIVAYQAGGTGSAVLALLTPPFSEMYWFWQIWGVTGAFWNVYSVRLALLIAWGLSGFLIMAFGLITKDAQKRQTISLSYARRKTGESSPDGATQRDKFSGRSYVAAHRALGDHSAYQYRHSPDPQCPCYDCQQFRERGRDSGVNRPIGDSDW